MIAISATIKKGRLPKQMEKLKKLTRIGLLSALEESAIAIHSDVIKSIQKQSSGKVMFRYNAGKKRLVTVSRPGDAPNTDLGDLVQSYQFDVDKKRLEAFVGSNLKKAVWLEFGTKKMKARPHLGPAASKNRKNIPKIFKVDLKKNIKKVK